MIPPTLFPTWLAKVAYAPTWTGWRAMQGLADGGGWWGP